MLKGALTMAMALVMAKTLLWAEEPQVFRLPDSFLRLA